MQRASARRVQEQVLKCVCGAGARHLLVPEPASSAGKCSASSVEVETANMGENAGYDAVFEVVRGPTDEQVADGGT